MNILLECPLSRRRHCLAENLDLQSVLPAAGYDAGQQAAADRLLETQRGRLERMVEFLWPRDRPEDHYFGDWHAYDDRLLPPDHPDIAEYREMRVEWLARERTRVRFFDVKHRERYVGGNGSSAWDGSLQVRGTSLRGALGDEIIFAFILLVASSRHEAAASIRAFFARLQEIATGRTLAGVIALIESLRLTFSNGAVQVLRRARDVLDRTMTSGAKTAKFVTLI